MKSLDRNIFESIMDLDDNIKKTKDQIAKLNALEWLKTHGIKKDFVDGVIKRSYMYKDIYCDDTWHFKQGQVITLSKGDSWPEGLKVAEANAVRLIDYDGTEIPEQIKKIRMQSLIIRNCPKLKSLQNCPSNLEKFAVSGCPELKDLKGCPKRVKDIFKFINNGVKVDAKIIKKYCIVDKKNIIFDHD
jgi:hypothetical protein